MGLATVKTKLYDADGLCTITYRAKTRAEVFRLVGIAPLFVELRVRRLQWLQELILRPKHHRVTLAALFGWIPGGSDPIDDAGAIARAGAHPWLQQVLDDLEDLATTDNGYDFLADFRTGDSIDHNKLIQEGGGKAS